MTDHRKSDNKINRGNFSLQVSSSQGHVSNLNFSDNFNYNIPNQTNFTNTNSFLSSGKRHRDESDRSGSSGHKDYTNITVRHQRNLNGHSKAGSSSGRKKELVRKIVDNLHKFSTAGSEELKNTIKNFSVEEFAKFFQVLSNMEYLTSLDSDTFIGKNKDIITINDKMINFNPEMIEDGDIEKYEYIDINKVIIRKDIPLKNLLKDEANILSSNNETLSNSTNASSLNTPSSAISFKSFFDEFFKTAKIENQIDVIQFKHLIKIYSNFTYNNKIISFTKEDKLLMDFIIENSLSVNQIENYYSICKYWLFEDFLNFEKNIRYDYIDITGELNQSALHLRRRYDSVLFEILNRIENHKELFDVNSWIIFINDLPRINEKVIENIISIHDKILLQNMESIKKDCWENKKLIDQLPHLKLMKNIYIKIKRPSNPTNLSEKLLNRFMSLVKNTDSYVITHAILFLMQNIFPIGKYEQETIKEFAVNQFRELVKVTEGNENIIKSKYALYLFLFEQDKDLIFELPNVYSESIDIVRNALNKHISKNLKKVLNSFLAEKLIKKCTDKCLPILLIIIDCLKDDSLINKPLIDNKLFRRIKEYYDEYSFIEILVALADKISLKDFFKSEINFIWERIKFFERNAYEENNIKIFFKLNTNKNESIFNELKSTFALGSNIFTNFTDKLPLYILYYILSANELFIKESSNINISKSKSSLFYTEFSLLIKYYKALKTEKYVENLSELLNVMKLSNVSNLLYLKIIEYLYDFFEKDTGDPEKETEISQVGEMILSKLKEFLNQNITSIDTYINELIEFIKPLWKKGNEILKKNLDERIKNAIRAKDYVVFNDI